MHNVLVYVIPTTRAYSLYVEDILHTVCMYVLHHAYRWMHPGCEVGSEVMRSHDLGIDPRI